MPQPDEIFAVSGSTRCGSSLMMRLLVAAGIPAIADMEQSMEHSAWPNLAGGDASYLAGAEGHCVKLPDIQKFPPPAGRKYRVVYMVRDPHEQAKSQLKFLQWTGFRVDAGRSNMRRLAASILRDRDRDIRDWRDKYRAPILKLRFEDLLLSRVQSCLQVQGFLGLPDGTVGKMVPLIIARSPKNYDGMMEIAMMGKDPRP